jgi:PAS domain S-box-containing protein
MTIALENAGADRGLLILPAEDDHLIQAEAKAAGDQIEVVLCQKLITGVNCPESIVRYVIRTRESVILDDASKPNIFSEDDYLRGRPAKSILCLPLIKQGRLTALLYLENTLSSYAFPPDRIAILELLAAQAAISLENTRLYSDLQEREAKVRRLVDSNIIGISIWDFDGRIIEANEAFLHIVGHSRDDIVSGRLRWTELTPTEWHDADERSVAELRATGSCKAFEKEYLRNDGSRVPVLVGATTFGDGQDEGVAFVLDLTERKRTESALQRSQAYLTQTQRLSHTSSWAWDVRLQEFVYRSPEVYHLFGFDPEKDPLSPQSFEDRILPEDRDLVIEMARQAVREKTDFEVDFRIDLPDGPTRYVHSVGHPLVGDDGEVLELVGTHIDVTEQHLAKEALQKAFDEIKKSEDRLRLVIDSIPTLVWRAGPDGVPDFLNQPALDYTGLSLDQAETGWPRAFHPDDKKGMLVKWSAIRESGMPGGLEARLRRFDGEYRWFLFQAVPLRDESGNIVKWYGSSTDIEDRKRAEVALRESEQRFRDYAETASDWLWEAGPDHRTTRISAPVNTIGFTPSGLTGLTRWDIATDVESEPEKWRQHRAMIDARRPFRNFVYTVNGNGAPVYVQTSGKPIYDATGNFLGYRGTGTDITAAIRADHAERALREAQAELAHVTRVTTLGELTASISHEVNQPLAAVVNAASACLRWLDGGTPNLDEARHAVDWIIKEGHRASEVIRRVRALANKTDIEKVPLDVNDVIREVMALVQRELVSHQVSLQMELAPTLPMILGDRVQLQQVIINLVMNGIEAMQSVTYRPRQLVIRSRHDEKQQVLVSVTDCGVGIPAENANRLFNAFFTTKSSGMGMGLSICRSIIEAQGGHLWATEVLPHGATFQFTLPANADTVS